MNARTEGTINEHLNSDAESEFRQDVLEGLLNSPKSLPCKYFYDTRGSELFEQICETPEYYVTRTELALLRQACPIVKNKIGPGAVVIEPGSGAGEKIRLLLDALDKPHSFFPIDISKSAVFASTQELMRDYPSVSVHPVVADFTKPFDIPEFSRALRDAPSHAEGKRVIFFPGSTISNFTHDAAARFLSDLQRHLRPGDFLFIGVDRLKDRAILESAYDDAQGVTAAFNLNLLERIARELDTTFDPGNFRHRAFFNENESRIEMHLDSLEAQTIEVCGHRIVFQKGESIHTENSYKYSPESFCALANRAGYEVKQSFSDPDELFGLYLCAVPG